MFGLTNFEAFSSSQNYLFNDNSLNVIGRSPIQNNYSLSLFSKFQLSLRACNLCSDCPISKLIDAFNSSQNYLSNDVLKINTH